MIQRHEAISSLAPSASFCTMKDGTIVWSVTPDVIPTEDQIQAELSRLQAIEDANAYKEQRARAYPSIADQLDLMYHGGYDAWKAAIEAVKTQFPKG